jgi:NhaP-type Na+/H+ and K+/H+ antiporter
MKPLGIILIAAGILMFIFGKLSFTKQEKIVDIGPVEINKKEKKTVDWPGYAGGIAILAGIVVLVADRKKAG